MPRNRNVLGLVDVIKLGINSFPSAVDMDLIPTGGGSVVFVFHVNEATFSSLHHIVVQESNDNSNWSDVDSDEVSWKFSDIDYEPGEYEGYDGDTADRASVTLSDIYGTTTRTGSATHVIVQAQYNGNSRYARLYIAPFIASEVLSVTAIVRRGYRTDAESLPA